jgi:hypothetical protein
MNWRIDDRHDHWLVLDRATRLPARPVMWGGQDRKEALAKLHAKEYGSNPAALVTVLSHVLPGGDVGGDAQAGESWGVRFLGDMQPESGVFAVVDLYFYPVWADAADGVEGHRIECSTWRTLCTDLEDVGSSETWADVDYGHPSAASYPTVEAAEDAAYLAALGASAAEITWDGVSI